MTIQLSPGKSGKKLSPIEILPTVVVHHHSIFNYFSDKELHNLSQTSPAVLVDSQSSLQKRASKKLLAHIVQAAEEQALAMIHANPTLLFYTSEATDYSGRPYNHHTPFQAALLCHDVSLWKKIEPYFDKLTDGQAERARQLKEVFPKNLPQKKPYDFSDLVQAITHSTAANIHAALEKTQNDTTICKTLNTFRTRFTALAIEEPCFNPLHLIEAIKVYNEQYDHWSADQRDLFWRQVIGYTERFMPVSQIRVFLVYLHYILGRRYSDDSDSYFPLVDSSGLGFDFGISVGRALQHGYFCGLPICRRSRLLNFVHQMKQGYLDSNAALASVGESTTSTDNNTLIARSLCTIS